MAVTAPKTWAGSIVLAAALIAAVGCGGPKTYPAHGSVFVAGKPAAGAIVVLHPVDAGPEAKKATARVGDDGTFKLGTTALDDGAQPGEYAVAVAWFGDKAAAKGDQLPTRLSPAYANPTTSKLRATIAPGDNALPRFDLPK